MIFIIIFKLLIWGAAIFGIVAVIGLIVSVLKTIFFGITIDQNTYNVPLGMKKRALEHVIGEKITPTNEKIDLKGCLFGLIGMFYIFPPLFLSLFFLFFSIIWYPITLIFNLDDAWTYSTEYFSKVFRYIWAIASYFLFFEWLD